MLGYVIVFGCMDRMTVVETQSHVAFCPTPSFCYSTTHIPTKAKHPTRAHIAMAT